jgi:Na+(H+)/acetate symporter ActP
VDRRTLAGLVRVMSFAGRHPVGSYLVLAFAIIWASWMPVLFFGAPPRTFTAAGAILGFLLRD